MFTLGSVVCFSVLHTYSMVLCKYIASRYARDFKCKLDPSLNSGFGNYNSILINWILVYLRVKSDKMWSEFLSNI